jgi:hypothetical protein
MKIELRMLKFPIVAYSVYDYIKHLKGLTYPSEEYVKTREEVSACKHKGSRLTRGSRRGFSI